MTRWLLSLSAFVFVAGIGLAAEHTKDTPAEVKKSLGLSADDHIVAFIYTGGGLGALFAPGKPATVQDAMLQFPG